jgi:hypothetical protein
MFRRARPNAEQFITSSAWKHYYSNMTTSLQLWLVLQAVQVASNLSGDPKGMCVGIIKKK